GTVFVTFLGFEIIATVAGEIEDPGRLIPLTMVLSVVSVSLLYVVIMLVSTGVVPYQELGDSLVPVSDVAAVYLGTAGVVAVVVAAAVAAISSSNSSVLAASRVIFAMGRDSLMSEWLSATHDRFNTPHRAILVTGAVTGLLVALGLEVAAIVALLAEVASFSFLVSYALVHVALVTFRYVDPPAYDPDFRVPDPLFPAVPVVGVLAALVVISQMATVVLVVGTGIVALGVAWYFVYARSRDVETGLLQEAYRERSVDYKVVVPVANPDTQRGLLRLAAAAARAGADGGRAELVAVNVLQVADESPQQNIEAGRVDHQRELLAAAREAAAGLDVELRTEAVVGQHVDETILEVLAAEEPDEALLGWRGTFTRGQFVFGSNLDAVVERAPCDLSLVNVRGETVGRPVALAGPGPHAPVAARRAAEFATVDDAVPVLLNVQEPGDRAQERGEAAITEVAEAAGLEDGEYESRVVVADDVEAGILDAVVDYDTVCVGLSEKSPQARSELGSVAERISERVPANVAIVRGAPSTEGRERVAAPAGEQG
ncbi:MAG: amino acid permease, partial [Haloarculaceae archaeon]